MKALTGLVSIAIAAGCAARPAPPAASAPAAPAPVAVPDAPWRAAAEAPVARESGKPLFLRGARLLLGDGRALERGAVHVAEGRIVGVHEGDPPAPAGAVVIDATGKWVTPGLIDTHSHLGVYPSPRADAHADGNEATAPVTAAARAVDSIWAFDPGFERALRGGVTTLQVLPGSANLIGGRAVTIKLRRATDPRALRVAGSRDGLKLACGENPKRVYGSRKQDPSTRMGSVAGQRAAFARARRLIVEWDRWRSHERRRLEEHTEATRRWRHARAERRERERACADPGSAGPTARQCREWRRDWAREDDDPSTTHAPVPEPGELPPARDLELETLAGALEGRLLVHVHCYRSDDMMAMLALADEAGFRIRSFHHALEAYKIVDVLAERGIAVSTWADWWGFKLEAFDGIPENAALVELAAGRPVIHSDSAEGIQRLNQEAAKAVWAGKHAGLDLDERVALRWVTMNPAWALGLEERVGLLEAGKDADLVVWSADPLSVYARAERVIVDGVERFDAAAPGEPWSDFQVAP